MPTPYWGRNFATRHSKYHPVFLDTSVSGWGVFNSNVFRKFDLWGKTSTWRNIKLKTLVNPGLKILIQEKNTCHVYGFGKLFLLFGPSKHLAYSRHGPNQVEHWIIFLRLAKTKRSNIAPASSRWSVLKKRHMIYCTPSSIWIAPSYNFQIDLDTHARKKSSLKNIPETQNIRGEAPNRSLFWVAILGHAALCSHTVLFLPTSLRHCIWHIHPQPHVVAHRNQKEV